MDIQSVRHKVYELASQIAEESGLELVTIDVIPRAKSLLLRIVVDKESGVTIGDCERLSRNFEPLLDVENIIAGSYILEVSSPGLDRPLITQKDFDKSIGKLVRVITKERIDNETFFIGRLVDVGEDWIRIRIDKKKESKDIFIQMKMITKARLEIEMKRE
jgi:ribosome maturation factor RimP